MEQQLLGFEMKTPREETLEAMLLSVIEEHTKMKTELEFEIEALKAQCRTQRELIAMLRTPGEL